MTRWEEIKQTNNNECQNMACKTLQYSKYIYIYIFHSIVYSDPILENMYSKTKYWFNKKRILQSLFFY